MKKLKIFHHRENCIGCNSCVEHSPQNWKISKEDGRSELIDSKETKNGIFIKEITPLELEENKLAAEDCPSRIIRIAED